MLTNSIQTGVVCNPVNDQETSQKPIDTDGYVSPVVVALGSLETVQADLSGRYYDGPNTTRVRY